MLKKAIIFSFFFLLTPSLLPVGAAGEFYTDVSTQYQISETGKTLVTNTITIENTKTEVQATSFILDLQGITPLNSKAYEKDRLLRISSKKEGDNAKLQVDFENPVAGQGKQRTFVIEYENDEFAQRTGEVWEISIPRLGSKDAFRSYSVTLAVPDSFGQEAYMTPNPINAEASSGIVTYAFGNEAEKTGISAGFGEFQVFSFSLNYHIENPIAKTAEAQIALPPDTSVQRVYYQGIEPSPQKVIVDEDGNWLATYVLKPKERMDVSVTGTVQILAAPRQLLNPQPENLLVYTQPTKYWATEDAKIKEFAGRLKNPKEIYDFVTSALTYDYQRAKPNVERLGASDALKKPSSAICMEFTDLFIAIARASGIPAREINGFAYTENPKIQPLSLVADVLHSWPEYWDFEKKTWVPVDPTWGSTTGGVDYFTKLDLRHFAFVVHGKDDAKPYPPGSYKLGPNPQKDVFVSFGSMPKIKRGKAEITTSDSGFSILNKKILVKVRNVGASALYNITPQIYFDQESVSSELIAVLPPLGVYETEISVPYGFLGIRSPSHVKIEADNSEVVIPTNKGATIVSQLSTLSFVLLLGLIALNLKTAKIKASKIFRAYADRKKGPNEGKS